MFCLEDVKSEEELLSLIAEHAKVVDTWQEKPWTAIKMAVWVFVSYKDESEENPTRLNWPEHGSTISTSTAGMISTNTTGRFRHGTTPNRNRVLFESYGFTRQRQYTSIVARKWKVVVAGRDDWSPRFGVELAKERAVYRLFVNMRKVRRRRREAVKP